MIGSFIEAYNKTLDAAFRILDWVKNRPINKLKKSRKELEILSREAQLKGDINELHRIRAKIEEIDRNIKSLSS